MGYLFSGMLIIYALSGISLNHKNDWNPNYIIHRSSSIVKLPSSHNFRSDEIVAIFLQKTATTHLYKKHYYPSNNEIKIFLKGGSLITYSKNTEILSFEELKKRPLFYSINFLHFNPGKVWKWFSDIFCICIILVTITGFFILKGRNGIKGRGIILIIIGILIPTLFFFIY